MTGWKYYNYAMIPDCLPNEIPEMEPIISGEIWKSKPVPVFVRYTSDFDNTTSDQWWYVIKDEPFDINSVKAKRRYEINKGNKNFEVRRLLNPAEYGPELYDVQAAAFSAYPAKYRPNVRKEDFLAGVQGWVRTENYVYGAFSRVDNRLCGYALLTEKKNVLDFRVLKTRPDSEKYAVNAAIVYGILLDFNDKLQRGYYICDGERSVFHETAFQDYLEKYFSFRKAYCKLHVEFNPKIKPIVQLLYQFRSFFKRFDSVGLVHKMNGIFAMQEIMEGQKEQI